MKIETNRLIITELATEMISSVHLNSMDDDNRRFLPDEVFETLEDTAETVDYLISRYESSDGPFVYAVLLRDGSCDKNINIGHVQLVRLDDGKWEVGYHIAKKYAGFGYATEAVKAFLPVISKKLGISEVYGICLKENAGSVRVLEKCGFEKLFCGEGEYQGKKQEIIKFVWKFKKELNYSTYAVTLYFDDKTSTEISNLTAKLANIISNDYMIANSVPPHLTLGMFHVEDSDSEKMDKLFREFVETANKEVLEGKPLELPFSGPDSFLDKVLFLKPVVNEKLVSLNKLLHQMFVPCFMPGDNRNYLPENWVPHIALAVKLAHEQFEKGMDFLKHEQTEREQVIFEQTVPSKIISIGLAKCNPYTPVTTIYNA